MCPEFHEVIEGKHIALCEHPNILSKEVQKKYAPPLSRFSDIIN